MIVQSGTLPSATPADPRQVGRVPPAVPRHGALDAARRQHHGQHRARGRLGGRVREREDDIPGMCISLLKVCSSGKNIL